AAVRFAKSRDPKKLAEGIAHWGRKIAILAVSARARTAETAVLHRFESELEIVDEIAQIFDTDGNSNERISDAERVAFFFRHGSVSHERGMIDQTFDAAQTFREREEMRVL